ncbi:MAG: hypothetical protein LBU56_05140 [Rickettsiales bacterium]|jgi:hypothetical protein|nr:hypothetical protein [Rickettsiales bacterium]
MSEKSKIKRALHSINNVSDKLLEKVANYGYSIEDLSKKAANRVSSNAKSLYGKVTKADLLTLTRAMKAQS